MHAHELIDAMDGVVLVIGPDLRTRAYGRANWDTFWLRNGGDAPLDLEGREVTDFFSAGEVRDTFRRLFRDVLDGRRRHVKIDYRCDAPSTIRRMRLSVTPLQGPGGIAGLLYQSIHIASEHRPAVPLASENDAEDLAVKVCTICARIAWPLNPDPAAQVWIEPEDYYRDGGEARPRIAHSFCRPCYRRLECEFD